MSEPASRAAVQRFNEAFSRQDIDAVMACMTEDCVFEDTRPAPDGTRYEGQEVVRAAFLAFFGSSPEAQFTIEELFVAGDHGIVRWLYQWRNDGPAGHVRGVDIFRLRDGKVAEKLSYVKG